MKRSWLPLALLLFIAGALLVPDGVTASVQSQCPTGPGGSYADKNRDGFIRARDGEITNPVSPNQVCMHLTGGDGYVVMADGYPQYMFGFSNVTGIPDDQVMNKGMLAAEWPGPTIALEEGDELYVTLTNVGMKLRPDLFDPHSVHYHGIPHSSNIFDGLPESGITINMGASLTYFYKNNVPGTYLYHCHVEATEHMQMGMLGNLYVRPAQNRLPAGTSLNGFIHKAGFKYAYKDGDGSTYYDVEYPLQLGGFDSNYHDKHINVQPLPFADMEDNYPMINGRGYPDTVTPTSLSPPNEVPAGVKPQKISSLITANQGQKVLLRINSVNVARWNTIACLGIPMKVVGKDAALLRSEAGRNMYYTTNALTIGGGETYDVILDTTGVAPGTYFLYTTNFDLLSNFNEDFGGMMTEIRIN